MFFPGPIRDGEIEPRNESFGVGSEEVSGEAFVCTSCGEEIVFEGEFDRIMREIADVKVRHTFRNDVGVSGKSLIVRLPKKLAELLGIRKGRHTELVPQKGGFLVRIDEGQA